MVFRWLWSSSLTVPKAPTTIGITVALTSHNFCTCTLKSWCFLVPSLWYFNLQEQLCQWFCILSCLCQWLQYLDFGVIFLYLFGLQSPKKFYICHFLELALVDVRTICLHIKSQISCTGACLFLYCFPAKTEHKLTIWVTLSAFSLQSLHSRDSSWWVMSFFIAFVLSACSWAAHIRLLVSLSSSPACSHCHLLWSCIPSVSLRNWPCNAFAFDAACLSFCCSSLFSPSIFVLNCNSSVGAFRSLSLLFAA